MSHGYHGQILKINLTEKKADVEKKDENFFRKYLGGPGIGAYYALKEIPKNADPLGPENVLVIAGTSIMGGAGVGTMRYTVSAKSPLTGFFGKSESGGWWGPEFNKTGYDALVLKGKAQKPSYILIEDGEVHIKNDEKVWGKTTKEVENILKDRHGGKIRVLQAGLGGENKVLYANLCNDLAHYNGRNGMGAVMASKNIRAIAVQGNNKAAAFNKEKTKEIMKWSSKNVLKNPKTAGLHEDGTAGGVTAVSASGWIPTNNWQKSKFPGAEKTGSEALEEILIKRGGCFGCPVKCKRVVEYEGEDFEIDPDYGGPEYETLLSLGSNCGIDDIKILSKANELCNKYAIDTISFGMTLSFAMHCYQEGLLTKEDTDGLELVFGNNEILCPLIEKTAKNEGFGRLLARGSVKMAEKIGVDSRKYLREVKNQEIPMHDPRVKTGLGLQYALSNNGADHWAAQHDPYFTEEDTEEMELLKALGIYKPIEATDLSSEKVRFYYYTNLYTLLNDCLGTCNFVVQGRGLLPIDKYIELVKSITGWKTTLWELLKASERTSNMMRLFNIREGLSYKDDKIPEIFFENIKEGPLDGKKAIDKEKFNEAIIKYYKMAGWSEKGKPTKAKLEELSLAGEFDI